MPAGLLSQEDECLQTHTPTFGPLLGLLVAGAAGAGLALDLWAEPDVAGKMRGAVPFFDALCRVLLALGLSLFLYWRKTIRIHRDATVEIIRHFMIHQHRKHYSVDEAFGLTVQELEIPDPEQPMEIYAIELLLMDGKRIRLFRFASLSDLHDCRREIEAFTGQDIARKRVLDPLHR
jgi:hypothetical protein